MNFNLGITKAFIAADPVKLEFTSWAKTPDGAGGWTLGPVAEPTREYIVRLIPQADKVPISGGLDGTREAPEYILLGLPDFDIRLNDTFEWSGIVWKINYRHRKPHYEGKWDVIKYEG